MLPCRAREAVMPRTVVRLSARDIRMPTSESKAGSDAMHVDPDYSGAYVILETDAADGLCGHGMTFTIGRGNEICVAAINALKPLVMGLSLESIIGDMAGFWRRITGESQLRWIGPEKGVIHLATAAIVNAIWDLWAKVQGKPVWQLVADLTPEQFVGCIDFRYLTDALTRDEALQILRDKLPTRAARAAAMRTDGYPAYITSAGWMGYPDDLVRKLCREAPARAVPSAVDRGAHQPRRYPRTCRHSPRNSSNRCCDRRTCRQPRHLQAADAGRCDRFLPVRQLPPGRT